MKIEYKVSVAGKDVSPVATCEVPDLKFEVKETPNSIEKTCTMHEIDAVEETLLNGNCQKKTIFSIEKQSSLHGYALANFATELSN